MLMLAKAHEIFLVLSNSVGAKALLNGLVLFVYSEPNVMTANRPKLTGLVFDIIVSGY